MRWVVTAAALFVAVTLATGQSRQLTYAEARPVLEKVMEGGRRLRAPEPLEDLQERCRSSIGLLPPHLKDLQPSRRPYQVQRSTRLDELVRDMSQVAR